MATSITSFCWHQFFRYTFIVFGTRLGGALLRRPGALLGAFGVSAVLHYVGLWGLGKETEFSSADASFVLTVVGAVPERVWRRTTGTRVRGFWGWTWTMSWFLGHVYAGWMGNTQVPKTLHTSPDVFLRSLLSPG
jgi:hypothetical protein